MTESQRPIVFFDGACNLCNGFVDWLMRRDQEEHFLVASLQGTTASRMLNADTPLLSSIVFYDPKRGIFTESTAVLMIFEGLPFPWRWARVLLWVPRNWRDFIYRFVARHRYRFFGKRSTCRLPTPQERSRFLD